MAGENISNFILSRFFVKARENKLIKPRTVGRRRSSTRNKPSTIFAYIFVFILIVAFVSFGYTKPDNSTTGTLASAVNTNTVDDSTVVVDEVIATSLAASIADSVNLPVSNSVANLAVSTQIKDQIAQVSSTDISKPQIIESTNLNRSVASYVVQIGDTVDSLAAKFGISKNTIKWANNLSSDNLTVGQTLKILPIDGVLYTVKDGDTIESISKKYGSDQTQIILYNDLDVSGIKSGIQIILPSGNLPDSEKPGYVAVTTSASKYSFRAGTVGNGYAYGNCTWYAYERRAQLGRPVGSFWGNANTWAFAAAATGYTVDRTPEAGAVLVSESDGWYGHVAVVESVAENGDITISEMNNYAYGGWNIVNSRIIKAAQVASFKYIH